jgi:hypothetical protein
MKVLFKEKQRISLVSLAVLLPIFILLAINLYQVFDSKLSFGKNLENNPGLSSLLVLVCILVWVSILVKLDTSITSSGITVSFFPALLKPRTILWSDVDSVFVREYNPLQEFGGWGLFRVNLPVQRGLGNNRAINLKGNKGLQLVMKDGSRLLIGTQKVAELKRILKEIPFLVKQGKSLI